jgi:Ca2+-binding RTX toxin-like protein
MKKLVAVNETLMTDVGLLRPGIPYALDTADAKHKRVLDFLFPEKGTAIGVSLTEKTAAALLEAGAQHSPDDIAGPVLVAEDQGNDTLAGGAGNDTLAGGAGAGAGKK